MWGTVKIIKNERGSEKIKRQPLSSLVITLQKRVHVCRKADGRAEASEDKLRKSERVRGTIKQQLEQALAFSRELISDQEMLLRQLAERTQETSQVIRVGSSNANRMDLIRNKLKVLWTLMYSCYISIITIRAYIY